MTRQPSEVRITRRVLLARLAAFALSLTGARVFAQTGGGLVAGESRVAPWDERFELAITIHMRPGGSRRPFVAVWLENPAGKSVRTVRLWVQKARSRWIADLTRWFRLERERRAQEGGNLVMTIAAATRQPGRYTVRWDGKDDAGAPVEQGTYFVCVESVREGGGGEHLIRQSFTFDTTPFKATLEGSNPEISEVSIEYRQRATTA